MKFENKQPKEQILNTAGFRAFLFACSGFVLTFIGLYAAFSTSDFGGGLASGILGYFFSFLLEVVAFFYAITVLARKSQTARSKQFAFAALAISFIYIYLLLSGLSF